MLYLIMFLQLHKNDQYAYITDFQEFILKLLLLFYLMLVLYL